MTPGKASLPSAPLTDGPSLNEALYARCGELNKAIGRLSLLPAHDALTLRKSSFINCIEDNAHALLFPMFRQRGSGTI